VISAPAFPPSIAKALVQAQIACEPVEKDSTNSFHKYKYASSDDMVAAGKRAMNSAGLALARIGWAHEPAKYVVYDSLREKPDAAPHGEYIPARLVVTYALASAEGETVILPPVSVPVLPEKGRPEDKAEAAALTYSHGYVVLGLLELERADESDVDRRDDRDRGQARPQARTQRAPEPKREDTPPAAAPTPLDTMREADELLAYVKTKRDVWSALRNGQRKTAVDKVTATAVRVGANPKEILTAAGLG
jgi:hypothetical protein